MKKKLNPIPADLSIKLSSTILSALKHMDKTNHKLLLVFNNADRFVGLLSIGDIQRAIIQNKPLETSIGEIMRSTVQLAHDDEPFAQIKAKMLRFRTEYMPVIDQEKQLVGLYFWDDVFGENEHVPQGNLDLPVVIMAGGKGNRLKPITNILPKPLIPIGEKPIIEHIMESFKRNGSNQFYISLNYKAGFIKDYIQNYINPSNAYQIQYFVEEKPLGTAGSLSLIKGKIKSTFFISNCDILIEQDYTEIFNYHQSNRNELTIVAALKHYNIPYGTVETGDGGDLLSLKEKPELTFKINSGLYILEPHLLAEIPDNTFFHITQLIENIMHRGGKIGVFPVSEGSWKDIGVWDEYLKNYKKDN